MILLKNICLSKGEEMVITIARTFGSGGKSAAVELAGRLGIPCYENEIMDMAAEASGINRQFFYASSEKARRRSFLQMIKNCLAVEHDLSLLFPYCGIKPPQKQCIFHMKIRCRL